MISSLLCQRSHVRHTCFLFLFKFRWSGRVRSTLFELDLDMQKAWVSAFPGPTYQVCCLSLPFFHSGQVRGTYTRYCRHILRYALRTTARFTPQSRNGQGYNYTRGCLVGCCMCLNGLATVTHCSGPQNTTGTSLQISSSRCLSGQLC